MHFCCCLKSCYGMLAHNPAVGPWFDGKFVAFSGGVVPKVSECIYTSGRYYAEVKGATFISDI